MKEKPKLLILAHGPPPAHGQSQMTALLLASLREKELPFEVFHIDCRYSSGLGDLGQGSFLKLLLALVYTMQALWLRAIYGVRTLYFIPAPPKRVSIWRDWIVLGILKPFFPRIILHWHAIGLPDWLATRAAAWEKPLTESLYRKNDLSLCVLDANRADAAFFQPQKIEIVHNGIPDPCPDFDARLLPRREARATRLALFPHNGETLRLLYLSAATRQKGLFDALEAWRLANLSLASASSVCSLTVAGAFLTLEDEEAFHWAKTEARLELETALGPVRAAAAEVRLLGPVTGAEKEAAFAESDLFLFPSHHDSFGLALVEAAHYGLPCLTTQPLVGEGLSPDLHVHVPLRDPAALAAAILNARQKIGHAAAIRAEALSHFSAEVFGQRVRDVLTANIA